ncbi:uncharacterized protein SEPMUDRAFT_108191 [Sphaerulina musiva SO2202]|uniref:Uncharacterized protein n=1 Tax=Sphaerulina musiva (strain SO2202) TaxID=692275 RepID=M3CFY5_SPHMS|nr:uncharacterized protein SEPMUDRAFT_108191 [Sphaerulina musiva SO2202]EMF12718.1 hypothetical protein SEPMUDRAFT_108191 [Sphaerulina musiva SO2202]
MPVYLLHGFKWPRPLIRIHIILQNLDDAAAEWLVSPGTTECMLDNFHALYPDLMQHLPNLRFVEQFDPADESTESNAPSQPFAYVADVCQEVKLGINIDEYRGKLVTGNQWSALMELRDKIAPEEKPGWFVVVCGDEERWAPPTIETLQEAAQHNGVSRTASSEAESAQYSHRPSDEVTQKRDDQPRGLKKLFGGFSRKKSLLTAKSASDIIEGTTTAAPVATRNCNEGSTVAIAERNGDSRTMKSATPPLLSPPFGAVELSVVPPTRAGDDSSGSRSISPIEEEPWSTPGTEYSSDSRFRRRSDTALWTPQSVSQGRNYRASCHVDRFGGVSPVSARSPSPLSRLQSPADVSCDGSAPSPYIPTILPERQNGAWKRHTLHNSPSLSRGPPLAKIDVAEKDEEEGQYEVISMAPKVSTLVIARHDARRQRLSHSSIKDRTSPDTYRPKGPRFPVNPSPQSRRSSYGTNSVFGQKINQFDLVANSIENALVAMR